MNMDDWVRLHSTENLTVRLGKCALSISFTTAFEANLEPVMIRLQAEYRQ